MPLLRLLFQGPGPGRDGALRRPAGAGDAFLGPQAPAPGDRHRAFRRRHPEPPLPCAARPHRARPAQQLRHGPEPGVQLRGQPRVRGGLDVHRRAEAPGREPPVAGRAEFRGPRPGLPGPPAHGDAGRGRGAPGTQRGVRQPEPGPDLGSSRPAPRRLAGEPEEGGGPRPAAHLLLRPDHRAGYPAGGDAERGHAAAPR